MKLFDNRKRLAMLLSVFVLISSVYLGREASQSSLPEASSDDQQTLVINALGDSITYGSGTEDAGNVYANQVGQNLGADKVNNYGVPSSPISNTENPALSREENENLSFLKRADNMDKDADLIFVFGGVNDYSLNVPMGDVNDSSSSTFSGSLNLLFHTLENEYPKSSIIALTPLKRYDQTGANDAGYELEDYANQINTIADKYDRVNSIDLFHASELDFTEGNNKELLVDGLHPNDEGQTRIAEYITATLTAALPVGISQKSRFDSRFRQMIATF